MIRPLVAQTFESSSIATSVISELSPMPPYSSSKMHPEELVLAEELDDVPRELRRLVDLGRARRDPLARERPHELADLALLVGQRVEGAHGFDSRADTRLMVIPLRILVLVIAATGVACAAMTLLLVAAPR